MISALQKISQDSTIESIQKDTVAAMCIETPFSKKKRSGFFSNMLSTHPRIEDRIKALQNY
jgi:Zn-dependent protease with chaperone function